jgi:hypothetical protein
MPDAMISEEPQFPILDQPMKVDAGATYALPPHQMASAVRLANHLAIREAGMPLRRRVVAWSIAARQSELG